MEIKAEAKRELIERLTEDYDFKWCPYCGCEEALITSKSETEAEKGMVIYCPACGKGCKVLVIEEIKDE